jgi:peroxiredoxin
MVALETGPVQLNFQAVDFSLLGVDQKFYSLNDVRGENGLLVMFICNHCPYVQAILDKIIRDTKELEQYAVKSVAIMSNDANLYPDDSFANMQKLAAEKQFPFPYLFDEEQIVAKAYDAVCTPDFFGFDKDLRLKYRGRLDAAKLDKSAECQRELFEAMVSIARTGEVKAPQLPSIGCSIKWHK